MAMILRIEEVVQVTGLSKATIYRRIRDQQFPPPVKLGGPTTRAVGWKFAAVDDWLAGLESADCGENEAIRKRQGSGKSKYT